MVRHTVQLNVTFPVCVRGGGRSAVVKIPNSECYNQSYCSLLIVNPNFSQFIRWLLKELLQLFIKEKTNNLPNSTWTHVLSLLKLRSCCPVITRKSMINNCASESFWKSFDRFLPLFILPALNLNYVGIVGLLISHKADQMKLRQ